MSKCQLFQRHLVKATASLRATFALKQKICYIWLKRFEMSTSDIKEQINKVLENAPDEVLESILGYLKELLSKSKSEALLSNDFNRILHEDKEVLEKLSK